MPGQRRCLPLSARQTICRFQPSGTGRSARHRAPVGSAPVDSRWPVPHRRVGVGESAPLRSAPTRSAPVSLARPGPRQTGPRGRAWRRALAGPDRAGQDRAGEVRAGEARASQVNRLHVTLGQPAPEHGHGCLTSGPGDRCPAWPPGSGGGLCWRERSRMKVASISITAGWCPASRGRHTPVRGIPPFRRVEDITAQLFSRPSVTNVEPLPTGPRTAPRVDHQRRAVKQPGANASGPTAHDVPCRPATWLPVFCDVMAREPNHQADAGPQDRDLAQHPREARLPSQTTASSPARRSGGHVRPAQDLFAANSATQVYRVVTTGARRAPDPAGTMSPGGHVDPAAAAPCHHVHRTHRGVTRVAGPGVARRSVEYPSSSRALCHPPSRARAADGPQPHGEHDPPFGTF